MNRETIIAELSQLPSATLNDALGGTADLPPVIRQMVPGTSCIGPAFTVHCRYGNTQSVVDSVDLAQKGDVLVIDTGNDGIARSANWGGTATYAAQLRGLAGTVINGPIRDINEVRQMRYPLFAAGTGLRGAVMGHPGQLQVPITIGDVIIHPGDYIVASEEGVLVVPHASAEAVIANAKARLVGEGTRQARLRAGVKLANVYG